MPQMLCALADLAITAMTATHPIGNTLRRFTRMSLIALLAITMDALSQILSQYIS